MELCKINMTNGDVFIVKNYEVSGLAFMDYVFRTKIREKSFTSLVLSEINKYDNFESNEVVVNVKEISSIEFMPKE